MTVRKINQRFLKEVHLGKVQRLCEDPDIKPEFRSGEEWESARQAAVQKFMESRR
jgi:hypothetical protein